MSDEKKRLISIKAIEVVNYTLNPRPKPKDKTSNIEFNLQVESRNNINIAKNLLIVTNNVRINEKETDGELGSMTVSLAFEVENISEVATLRKDMKYDIEPSISKMLTIMSLDTTRGILFAYFRGSYLQNTILPLIRDESLIEQKL